ncbi:MAG: SDR family oxidoreductase [Coriobacteriia bacterium]|nr:SDR family oxidoreductase [Coriobacteriia bacterium]MCL2746396.1 SDR family oxidoreductase [Coriobacteriia bacterium]MCL2870933.1 SDR family oxidoreductase [Coriobacteriia bacterium]
MTAGITANIQNRATGAGSVMITGASSGIGLELARHYGRIGKPLVLIARNEERLAKTADELMGLNSIYSDSPGSMVTVSLDVADTDAVNQQLNQAVQSHGVPELLINAAGIVNVGRFLEMGADYFNANLRIDLDGTVNVCRVIAPHMAKAGAGHIVNIASAAGFLGIYGYTGYSAAKFAVMGFSEALRFEMKPLGVAVSVVCPPDTKTPGLEVERSARPAETEAIAGGITALDPRLVAKKIVRGINSGRFYIIVGATSKFYFRLKGLLPEIFFAIVDAQIKDVARKAHKNGHQQSAALHDITSPSACLPEQTALNRGGYSTCN